MPSLSHLWNVIKSPSSMALLAVIGFALAIYQGFFYERRGEILVSVDALSRVFDVHKPIGGLDISYAGENLRSAKKALWVATFSIRNSGNAEIRKGDYDDNAPFGFQVVGAEVVDQPTIKTSVEYLKQNLKLKTDKDHVILSPVVLEPQDVIQISMLLLGPETSKPKLIPIGKIAGIRDVQVNLDVGNSDKSVWKRVSQADSVWIQPIRMVVYSLAGLVAILLFGGLIAAISSPIERIKKKKASAERQKRVLKYRPNESLEREERFLIDVYAERGEDSLFELNDLIIEMKERSELIGHLVDKLDEQALKEYVKKILPFSYRSKKWITVLEEANLISFEGAKPIFSPTLETSIKDLADYLKVDLSMTQAPDIIFHEDNSIEYLETRARLEAARAIRMERREEF